ncbi:MAG TPA: hypothetical protein VJV05_06325 [Pyrinomonadaceae bacterium]|nr:hypothetical protein [Pyrinomonadaceae bacterium]
MSDWRSLMAAGKFEEAEPLMLAEIATPDGYGGETVTQAYFYETWADSLLDRTAAITMYWRSHRFWATYASWSTSGGEGTARMLDVNRVLLKLECLRGKGDVDR